VTVFPLTMFTVTGVSCCTQFAGSPVFRHNRLGGEHPLSVHFFSHAPSQSFPLIYNARFCWLSPSAMCCSLAFIYCEGACVCPHSLFLQWTSLAFHTMSLALRVIAHFWTGLFRANVPSPQFDLSRWFAISRQQSLERFLTVERHRSVWGDKHRSDLVDPVSSFSPLFR